MANILKQSHTPELIFGLVAPIGVDLDRVTDALTELLREMEYGAASLRLTSLMKEVPTGLPLSAATHIQSYKERIAYANEVCNIRQFKRPEEIRLLRSVYGRQFILVSAYCPQEMRLKRIEDLERISHGGLISNVDTHNSAYELVSQDARETQDINGQNIRDAFPLGDVFIDATSRQTCIETLRRFIHLLFGNNEITPTHDEYGMYIAKSASLRSSDLSRQIGAAIFHSSGEIITMGCNEVPKAGGGTYWCGDHGE